MRKKMKTESQQLCHTHSRADSAFWANRLPKMWKIIQRVCG